jgi:hypothetical protein
MINSRRTERAGHRECLRETVNAYTISVGYLKGRYYLEDLDIDGVLILKLIIQK